MLAKDITDYFARAIIYAAKMSINIINVCDNRTARFKKCKQLFEYPHLLLLGDIWWAKY
jgi:hypothetical protein